MRFDSEMRGEVALVKLSGSIQTGDNESFADRLAGLRKSGAALVVFEGQGLDYINSRAIADLVMFHDFLHGAGGRMALAALSPMVDKVIRAVGLGALVDVYATAEEAVTALSG
ncbi:MAG: STAS domain-containing protein [Planctomycetota bacterium]|jgi:anti-anti-sigma factor